MKTKKTKKLALLIAAIMLLMVFSTTGFAAYFTKTLQANYRNITVFVNGTQKNLNSEPFIVDGTTYIPLRDIAEIMGSAVSFNPATYRIDITDTGTGTGLQYDLITKDARIAYLEKELAEKEDYKTTDLRDLEDQLNDDYDEIGDVDIKDIKLDGDEDDIEVEIYINTSRSSQSDAWDDLDDDDIEDFLQDIVDDIHKEFKDADITGFIEDEDNNRNLVEFEIDRRGNVELDTDKDLEDISDLEDALDKKFYKYEGLEFSFDVDDDRHANLEVNIEVKRGELTDLTNSEIKYYLEDVCEFIEDEYKDYNNYIFGILYDDYDEIEFEYDDGKLDWDYKWIE